MAGSMSAIATGGRRARRGPAGEPTCALTLLVRLGVRIGSQMKRVGQPGLATLPQHEAEDVLGLDRATLL